VPATVTLLVNTGSATHEYVYSERATCLVGRSDECDIRIGEAPGRVSRRHCRLEIDPPQLWIRDMGSRNGTYVNGRRLGRLTERALGHGDEVHLGDAVLHVAVSRTDEPDGGHRPPETIMSAMLRAASAGDPAFDAFTGYELVRELGRGAQGVVYLARHTGSGELVALKLLLAQVSVDPSARFGFLREFENIRALRHANIVEFRGSGASGDEFYFTCEYCAGGSVDQLVARRGGVLSLEEALPIVWQALDGLRYAHEATIPAVRHADGRVAEARGLVHRDIKPPNILLIGSGSRRVAKLGDFGLAKAFDLAGLSGHTRTGAIGGTIPFMARTQLINYRFAGPEVDVWAVAACLYWMLTGATPRDFPADRDPVAVALREPVVPIRARRSSVPPRLAAVVDEALVDKPRISITTADELARALRDAL
jgi:serine/threonine protein kinase